MATYTMLIKFSDQGMTNIKSTCARAAEFQSLSQQIGVEIRDIFWTLGQFDGLVVFDAPDEETATALTLQLAARGNVHTQTARAFGAGEMDAIISKIP